MATLPDALAKLLTGLKETRQDGAIRTPMSAGPRKARRRFSAVTRKLNGQVVLKGADIDVLDAFYGTTLSEGTLTFTMTDPRRGGTVTACFAKPPSYTHLKADVSSVDLEIDILP